MTVVLGTSLGGVSGSPSGAAPKIRFTTVLSSYVMTSTRLPFSVMRAVPLTFFTATGTTSAIPPSRARPAPACSATVAGVAREIPSNSLSVGLST